MATKITYHLAIFNLKTHKVEGIEPYQDRQKFLDREHSFHVEVYARGPDWLVYSSDTEPFSWEKVTPAAPQEPTEEPANA